MPASVNAVSSFLGNWSRAATTTGNGTSSQGLADSDELLRSLTFDYADETGAYVHHMTVRPVNRQGALFLEFDIVRDQPKG